MLLASTTLLTLVLCFLKALSKDPRDQFILQNERSDYLPQAVLDDEFAAWLEETGSIRGMKGVSIAVTRKNKDGNGWTTETKGFGVADRWGTPVDDETLFSIGSNSKLFTALGIGLLTTNNSISIDWDTKIKDILPESLWALQDPIAQEYADLVDILSHRTGLPRHDLSYSLTDTPETAVAKMRYLRPSSEFRQTTQYNNQMYIVGAQIISHLTGTPFQTYITRNIISPLDLNWTTYDTSEADRSGKLAEGFVDIDGVQGLSEDGKIRFKPVPFWTKKGGGDLSAGPGGVISNAKDMAIWLQALLLTGRSPVTNESVIPPSVVERVTDGVSVFGPRAQTPELSPEVYGMGQARYTFQGHEFIEHNGGTIGHYSVVTRSAHDGLGISVLINSMADPGFLEMIKWRLIEKSLGLEHIDWNARYPTRGEALSEGRNATKGSPRPSNGTPSTLPYGELAGVYFNPAYGTLTLCPVPPFKTFEPQRRECHGVSDALQPLLNQSAPVLLAAWSKIWSTHVLLHHVSGDNFDVVTVLTFPAPFPDAPTNDDDSRPFAVPVGRGSAEFVFGARAGEDMKHVEGIACRGAWGAGLDVKEPKGDGREGAEVWFDRVASRSGGRGSNRA